MKEIIDNSSNFLNKISKASSNIKQVKLELLKEYQWFVPFFTPRYTYGLSNVIVIDEKELDTLYWFPVGVLKFACFETPEQALAFKMRHSYN